MKYILLVLLFLSYVNATKIVDVSSILGVRENQIIGYSLVIGLKKTGDATTSKFTLQSISNILYNLMKNFPYKLTFIIFIAILTDIILEV